MARASAFVDGALQDIELLGTNFLSCHYELKCLQMDLRNLRTFILCARGSSSVMGSLLKRLENSQMDLRNLRTFLLCARGSSSVMGSLLKRLENSLIQNGRDFHNLCVSQKRSQMSDDLFRKVIQLENCIKSFSQEIIESYIILSDNCSLQSWDQLNEFFDSLLMNMVDTTTDPHFQSRQDPKLINAFKDKLVFFMIFFRLAELKGIEPSQLQVLLPRLQVAAVNASEFCYRWTFLSYFPQIFLDRFQLKCSELLLKIDPQIRELYLRVLTASNVSRSSQALTRETDMRVLGGFVETLLCNILEALSYGDSYMVSLKDQVHILFGGLRFLRTILTKLGENIDELHKKAKDLIGTAVSEAAIVIFLLSETALEEGSVKEIDFAVLNFLERITLIKVITLPLIFSKTNEHGFIDFLLETLKELLSCNVDSIGSAKDQIQTVQEDLVSLRSFLDSFLDQRNQDGKLQTLWGRVAEVAYNIWFVVNSLVVGDIPDYSTLEFCSITEEINLIKMEALKIGDDQYSFEVQEVTNTSNPLPSLGSIPAVDNTLVTLDDQANTIIKYLTSGSKRLDIISIVGMPGLGKTTLARSVYENPSVRYLFHTSAWCVVSQAYKKRDLLLRILMSVDPSFSSDQYSKKNEQDLKEKLRKCLLKRKYLIVLDDVWDIDAWSCLVRSFPDDANSSRILLTSRDSEVALKINPGREPHQLRHLTDNECMDLLQKKLSSIESFPSDLKEDLKEDIAKNCRGLPLTVVIIAGILANSNQYDWEWIAGRLSSSVLSDTDQCTDILELSFRKLPKNLKACLLYFGSFPEDAEIPVKKLIWFWIAEGFIEKCEPKSQEDVAKDYMKNLISRSLVIVSKERSIGGVKTCRIHDLLHEFCMVKAEKEKFLSLLSGHDELFTFLEQRDLQRLCVHSTQQDFEKSKVFCPGVRSLLFFAEDYDRDHYHMSFIFHFFKLLKVLDLININLSSTFPSEIATLVELRYLAIRGNFTSIPSAVANLSNLETLLVYAYKVLLPDTIWNMRKLRVMWSLGSFLLDDLAIDNLESSSGLHNLDTFSTLELSFGQCLEKILRKLPNIRRLKCEFSESRESNADGNEIVVMDFLSRLESLHLARLLEIDMHHIGFRFPMNLKKLTLLGFHSSIIPKSELPNLVVLKLDSIEFEEGSWDMHEEWEFPNLKFLQLRGLSIDRWTGTYGVDHFPYLEKLVLQSCKELEEVPSCLEDSSCLQMIEVSDCPESVVSLIMQIKECQNQWGHEDLQVLLTNNSDD